MSMNQNLIPYFFIKEGNLAKIKITFVSSSYEFGKVSVVLGD